MYNNHSDFNDENNLYHYSYRDSSQQPPQEPVQDLKPHKEKKPAPAGRRSRPSSSRERL